MPASRTAAPVLSSSARRSFHGPSPRTGATSRFPSGFGQGLAAACTFSAGDPDASLELRARQFETEHLRELRIIEHSARGESLRRQLLFTLRKVDATALRCGRRPPAPVFSTPEAMRAPGSSCRVPCRRRDRPRVQVRDLATEIAATASVKYSAPA